MLTKIVDGVEVEMAADEEAKFRAEWEANETRPAPEPAPTLDDLIAVLDPELKAKLDARLAQRAAPQLN